MSNDFKIGDKVKFIYSKAIGIIEYKISDQTWGVRFTRPDGSKFIYPTKIDSNNLILIENKVKAHPLTKIFQ